MSMRNTVVLFCIIMALLACGSDTNQDGIITRPQVKRDLEQIRDSGTLRVITIYSSTSYFLYRGQPMGFEYELISHLAEDLGLKLEIVVARDMDQLFNMLNRGEGDLVAYGLTITEPRKQIVRFTDHHYVTHQALVQRMPDNWRELPGYKIDKQIISDVMELVGDTVYVRKNSSYYQRLQHLMKEIGGRIYIELIPGSVPTDEIIRMVVDKKIDLTVADYNIAAINKTYYPILHIDTPISLSQRMAWAVRKNSPQLVEAVNAWLTKIKKDDFYYILYHKYFKNRKSFRRRIESPFFSKNTGKISKFDAIIKKYSRRLNWDWRLLSSMIYQESRFRVRTSSWAGARGLMQLMPATAKELGIKKMSDPEANIDGGTRYLEMLWQRWEQIPDSTQRIKFTLASYNCGYQHVRDAQRLAEKYGDTVDIWDDHIAEYILKLSQKEYYTDPVVEYGFVRGQEPFEYVHDIFERYRHYKKFIPR